MGVAVDMSLLGFGLKAMLAPSQDIDLFARYRTLFLVRTFSVGVDYYPLAVLSRFPVQPTVMAGYHWMRFTDRVSDGIGGFPPALNAALQGGNLGNVRGGFVSFGGGLQLRRCGGLQVKVFLNQLVQVPSTSTPHDGQSFAFQHVKFPNVGLEVGGYLRPLKRVIFEDRQCGRRGSEG